MSSLNKILILGKLGRDPELKYSAGGAAICNLSVATTEVWTQNGEKQERTEWHRVTVFGKIGENCAKYLTKGSSVYLEGRLQTRSWDDPKTNEKKYSTDIIATEVKFLSTKKSGSSDNSASSDYSNEGADEQQNTSSSLDDIPF
jgi:single-strand DNA-binding protein